MRTKLTCFIGLSFFFVLLGLQANMEMSNVFVFASESSLPMADECAKPLSWSDEEDAYPVTFENENASSANSIGKSRETLMISASSTQQLRSSRPQTQTSPFSWRASARNSLTGAKPSDQAIAMKTPSVQENRSNMMSLKNAETGNEKNDDSKIKVRVFESAKERAEISSKPSLSLRSGSSGSFPIEKSRNIKVAQLDLLNKTSEGQSAFTLRENRIENPYEKSSEDIVRSTGDNRNALSESKGETQKNEKRPNNPIEHAYSQGHQLETHQAPDITTVSFKEDVKVAQRFFFGRFGGGPDSGDKENRPFLNAETRPYSQPQKSTDVSSRFIFDADNDPRVKDLKDKNVPEPITDQPKEPDNTAQKNKALAELSSKNLADQELTVIDPEADDAIIVSDTDSDDTSSSASGSASLSMQKQTAADKNEPVKLDAKNVGNPHSSTLVRLMYDEIISGLRNRQIIGRYDMFRRYCGAILNQYVGASTGNERNGLYRLSWYDQLFRDPIRSIFEIEEFSRTLHDGLSGDHRHLAATMPVIREKLDIPPARNITVQFSKAQTPQQAVAEVRNCLMKAQAGYNKSIATLTSAEQRELAQRLYPIFCQSTINGHTIPQRKTGHRLASLIQKMDRTGIHEALESLIPLTDENFLRLLAELPEDAFPQVTLGSQVVQKVSTPAGDILIGGRGNNTYDLDAPGMQNVICVIDLGGNDTFKEGTCTLDRPVFVVISLGGNDRFTATKPGVQGGSILGISMLLNLKGKNVYQAGDVAQGSTLGGVGVLIDYDGDTSYTAMRHAQGYALGGVGLLIDRKGNDKYRAALLAQGLGHPGGFAVLEDCQGNDHYFLGGKYLDSYDEHPGYDGWGQGLGTGIRQVANGGIGALLDGSGNDVYEYDYFAHGGGYWFGVGFARDFKGNDKRHGATLLDYYGNPRSEARWQRFGCGFGCHYSIGALFDDEGDDTYGGTIMGSGMAWDLSAGFLCDFSGSDRFEASGGITQGSGAQAGIGILFNYGGNTTYLGNSQGHANPMMSYHNPSDAGSNFSFLIDYGGKDTYGGRDLNGLYQQRGGSGGFLIDCPFDVEVEAERIAAQKAAAERAANASNTVTNTTNTTQHRNTVQQSQQRYDAYGRPIRTSQPQQRRPANYRGY